MSGVQPLKDDDWPPEYEVQFEKLEEARSEEPFLRESFELLKEAASLTAMAAGITLSSDGSGHDRNNAVLVGHLVRMVKLMRTLIRMIVDDHGGDQQMQLTRQFLDSASTLAYLLEDIEDTARFDAYINDSLIAEREFLNDVRAEVKNRGGEWLPIEERIERSITNTFKSAGVRAEDLPSRRANNWPNAQQRLALLGPVAYSAYRTGSSDIHGAWHDLERNHLEEIDGQFRPQLDQAIPRPQPLFAMSSLAVTTSLEYIRKRYPFATAEFEPRFEHFLEKLRQADDLHEQYLTERMTPTAATTGEDE
jgi:hypothetical protein